MNFRSRIPTPAAAAFAALYATAAAAAAPTIAVTLGDGPAHKMAMTLSAVMVKAGAVEFDVKNASTEATHEFWVVPWPGALTALPYDTIADQADEDKLKGMQGIDDMKPGLEVKLRLILRPGKYVLFCDQPGHYKGGMVRRFIVTP
jgi:uncharacterized cupredoxin-like copper-binding protein